MAWRRRSTFLGLGAVLPLATGLAAGLAGACGHDWDTSDPRLASSGTAGGGGEAVTSTNATGGAGGEGGSGGAAGCAPGETVCADGCVVLETDADNCGACGHSCLGGACMGFACQPVVLVSGIDEPDGLAIDDSYIYSGSEVTGEVFAVPLAGGPAKVLDPGSGADGTERFAIEGQNLVWTRPEDGSLYALALPDGAPTKLLTGLSQPYGVALQGGVAYVTTVGDGTILKVPLSGGPPITLAMGLLSPIGIAVDATRVYVANEGTTANSYNDGSVISVPIGGGMVTTLASMRHPYGIGVNAGMIYFTLFNDGEIYRKPVAGGPAELFARGIDGPYAVAFDESWVYFTSDGTGSVGKVPIEGGPVKMLRTVVGGEAEDLAVDGKYVYWVDEIVGAIYRLAKD